MMREGRIQGVHLKLYRKDTGKVKRYTDSEETYREREREIDRERGNIYVYIYVIKNVYF